MVHLLRQRLLWPLLCRLGQHRWELALRWDPAGRVPVRDWWNAPAPRYCRRCGQPGYLTREEWIAAQATGRARD